MSFSLHTTLSFSFHTLVFAPYTNQSVLAPRAPAKFAYSLVNGNFVKLFGFSSDQSPAQHNETRKCRICRPGCPNSSVSSTSRSRRRPCSSLSPQSTLKTAPRHEHACVVGGCSTTATPACCCSRPTDAWTRRRSWHRTTPLRPFSTRRPTTPSFESRALPSC